MDSYDLGDIEVLCTLNEPMAVEPSGKSFFCFDNKIFIVLIIITILIIISIAGYFIYKSYSKKSFDEIPKTPPIIQENFQEHQNVEQHQTPRDVPQAPNVPQTPQVPQASLEQQHHLQQQAIQQQQAMHYAMMQQRAAAQHVAAQRAAAVQQQQQRVAAQEKKSSALAPAAMDKILDDLDKNEGEFLDQEAQLRAIRREREIIALNKKKLPSELESIVESIENGEEEEEEEDIPQAKFQVNIHKDDSDGELPELEEEEEKVITKSAIIPKTRNLLDLDSDDDEDEIAASPEAGRSELLNILNK